MDDIAIVGYGSLLPEADGSEAFWQNLLTARCSIRELPEVIWDCGLYFPP
jgi:acyl transferase domain-containing protein